MKKTSHKHINPKLNNKLILKETTITNTFSKGEEEEWKKRKIYFVSLLKINKLDGKKSKS